MSGDKTYTEQITEMAKSIKSNYFVQPTNEQLLKDAKEIVDGINEMSSSSIDNLLQ